MITAEQARIIYTLAREMGIEVGQSFTPQEVFPEQTERGSADRKLVMRLAAEGFFGMKASSYSEPSVAVNGLPVRFVMTKGALLAFDEWAWCGGLMGKITTKVVTTTSTMGMEG
jgi:hypothetical protein